MVLLSEVLCSAAKGVATASVTGFTRMQSIQEQCQECMRSSECCDFLDCNCTKVVCLTPTRKTLSLCTPQADM